MKKILFGVFLMVASSSYAFEMGGLGGLGFGVSDSFNTYSVGPYFSFRLSDSQSKNPWNLFVPITVFFDRSNSFETDTDAFGVIAHLGVEKDISLNDRFFISPYAGLGFGYQHTKNPDTFLGVPIGEDVLLFSVTSGVSVKYNITDHLVLRLMPANFTIVPFVIDTGWGVSTDSGIVSHQPMVGMGYKF